MQGRRRNSRDVLIIKKYSGSIDMGRLLYKLIRLLAGNINQGGR